MRELQTWERRVPGTDAVERALVDVQVRGTVAVVEVEESLMAQLLTDAGWERTA